MRKLKNPHYLTPSKASKLTKGKFAYLQNYLLKVKPETKEAMTKGQMVHEIFYSLIKNKGETNDLVTFPESWPTKAQCGISQDEQKKKWREKIEKEKKIIYPKSLDPVIEQIKISLHTDQILNEFMNDKSLKFEQEINSDKLQMAGFLDIDSSLRMSDAKTTSKEFSSPDDFIKWQEKQLAVQQIVYEAIQKDNGIVKTEPFTFTVIQLVWPFHVISVQLSYDLVSGVREWFYEVLYKQWDALNSALQAEFPNEMKNDPPDGGYSFDEKLQIWIKLSSGIYKKPKLYTAKASRYFMNELGKVLDEIRTESFRKRQ